MIIALEGVNGSGKTTQAKLLAEAIRSEMELEVASFLDPGVSHDHLAYLQIRPMARFAEWRNPMTRMMLYMAARCELIAAAWEAHRAGKIVILDRYAASFYVYGCEAFVRAHQESAGRGVRPAAKALEPLTADLDAARVNIAAVLTACGAFVPDVTVVLLVKPETANQRWQAISGAKPDVFESQGLDAIQALQSGYLAVADSPELFPYAGMKIAKITCEDDYSPEQVHESIWSHLRTIVTPAGFDRSAGVLALGISTSSAEARVKPCSAQPPPNRSPGATATSYSGDVDPGEIMGELTQLLEELDEAEGAAGQRDFFDSVREGATDMLAGLEAGRRGTEKQLQAAKNWRRGVSRWLEH